RHVEQLALPLRDSAGEQARLALQSELAQDLERLLPDGAVAIGEGEELPRHALAGEDRERHVVQERQLVEEVDELEAARDPGLDAIVDRLRGDVGAAEDDAPAVGAKEPADEVD